MRNFIGIGMVLLLIASGSANAGVVSREVLSRDMRGLFAPRSLGIVAVGFGLAGLSHRWDDRVNGHLESNAFLEASTYPTNIYGESGFNIPATLLVWGYAHITRHREVEAASYDVLRALGFVQLAVAPLKYGVRRERPDRSNRWSFPSGHAANAFAIAGVLGRRYGPKVGLPLYALGAVVGAGRLEDNKHYLSDVIAGAAIGTAVGLATAQTAGHAMALLPDPAIDGVQMVMTF